MTARGAYTVVLLVAAVVWVAGCSRHTSEQVVVYTSVDEPVARPILEEFEKQTGVHVLIVPDTEATKSNSLANKLEAERDHPQADVFWANEVFNPIHLAEAGVLTPYDSPAARDIPDRFKDPDHRWAAMGLRARVIAAASFPPGTPHPTVHGLQDLADPFWKGRIAMALPTAGTTGGHMAALELLWGREKAESYWRALRANGIHLLGGNSDVAEQVGASALWLGLTDNDDIDNARADGGKLEMVLPDQDTFGTLMLPCTVSLVAGAPRSDAGKKLVDFLLSPQTERRLIDARFARYPVRGGHAQIKAMDVDYRQVAAILRDASRRATVTLQGRE